MNFPAIDLKNDESLDAAFDRVKESYKTAGIEIAELADKGEAPIFAVARQFLVITDKGCHLFVLYTRAWTEDLERVAMPRIVEIWDAAASEGRELVLHVHSAYPLPSVLAYYLTDVRRSCFCLEAGTLFKQGKELSPERIGEYARATVALLQKYYAGRLDAGKGDSFRFIENLVLNVLRTEKDHDKPDRGVTPISALVGLACLGGEMMREIAKKDHQWCFKWIQQDRSVLLEFGMMEKKGFFSASKYRQIITANPINKLFKLFANGTGDSISGLYDSIIAMTKQELEKKA